MSNPRAHGIHYSSAKRAAYERSISSDVQGVGICRDELPLPSSVDEIKRVMVQAEGLCERVVQIANRLCGPAPHDESMAGMNPAAAGVFPEIVDNAQFLNASVDRAHDAINRIERHLP